MPGKHLTNQQANLYMKSRQQGSIQVQAAAKAGISERSGRNLERTGGRVHKRKHSWRTREDPLKDVWLQELVPLLEATPRLSPMTLLEYLQDKYSQAYPDKILRTLERRVKHWRSTHGPAKEVMILQTHPIGKQGISDFTQLKKVIITINNQRFKHLLYHFRLSHSGWSYMKVVRGGESYSALAEGLQGALWQLGGSPLEHRTDSLSAAFKNMSQSDVNDISTRYAQLCKHYKMVPTRNNRGKGHENGSIESPHGHLKRRIEQAIILRGSHDFATIESYEIWLSQIVKQHNKRNAPNTGHECTHLQPLPIMRTVDYTEIAVCVSSSATINVRRSTYTVPSQLIGSRLKVHLYDNRLECYLAATHVSTLERVFPSKVNGRGRNISYHHIIDTLVKKPQAFKLCRWRDDLLPSKEYQVIWAYINKANPSHTACKLMVGILYLASKYQCESDLAQYIIRLINQNKSIKLPALQAHFAPSRPVLPVIKVHQHPLVAYNHLMHNEAKGAVL